MIENKVMYSSIHHDRNNELMFVWYNDGSRMVYKTKHKFYTPNQGEYGARPCGMKDIYGKDMFEVITDGKKEMDLRARHNGPSNYLAELDIDFRTRWLQQDYQDVDDLRFSMKDFNICFLDIEVATKGKFPVASKAEYPVNCVTVHFSKTNNYFTFGLNREISEAMTEKLSNANCEYINCRTEYELLEQLFTKIGDNNVDILSGYNSSFFDNPYLINRAQKLGVDIRLLSRLPTKYKSVYVSKRDDSLKIAGTEVIDYLQLYRKFTTSERDNYKLDTIGFIEVGERKAPLPDGYMSYINHWDDYVWYNFKDVELIKQIDNKRRMFETTIGACAEARVPFGSIFEAKKMLVGFIVNILHKKNLTMPPLKEAEREWFPGAYVYSTPNYYEWLVSYDYRSMYPSIMMGANISPETKVIYPVGEVVPEHILKNLVKSPWTANGKRQVFYRKDKVGIVPEVVKILFDGRTELKEMMKASKKLGNYDDVAYYNMKQNAYKLFGNSLYGLLGNPYFQLYDIDNSASVTALGKELIQTTTKDLVSYFDNELEFDPRYKAVFGEAPRLSKDLAGTFVNEDGETCYKRLSHGDTDSFFVRYEDIYDSWKDKVENEVGVLIFNGTECFVNEKFTISNEIDAKKLFNKACKKYISYWDSLDDEKKKDAFFEGLVTDGKIRIIYNRYLLTDYCRIFDSVLLEDKLAEIMLNFSNCWNFYENTLYLKREKCIRQAIVTAKKKYICFVESNEEVKYFDINEYGQKYVSPKFAVTGLEIVRSSTTPFARERILTLITELLKNKDKKHIRKEYLNLKREYYQLVHSGDWYSISIPSGVKKTPPPYLEYIEWPEELRKKVDWRLRAGSVWNHLLDTDPVLKDMGLEPIFESSKVKFIKVAPNTYNISTIAYVGDNCPERMWEIFIPDWDLQWEKVLKKTMDRMFNAIGWGMDVENDDRELMLELF